MKVKDLATIVLLIMIGVILIITAGCTTTGQLPNYSKQGGLMPDAIYIEFGHESHSTTSVEDALTTVNVGLQWVPVDGAYVRISEGYNISGRNGGGFYGPAEVFTATAGYQFKLK